MKAKAALAVIAFGGFIGAADAQSGLFKNRNERPEPTRNVVQPAPTERALTAAELAACLEAIYTDKERNPNPQSSYSPGATAKLIEFLNYEPIPASRAHQARSFIVILNRRGLFDFNESKYGRVCHYRLLDKKLIFLSAVNLERDGRAEVHSLRGALSDARAKFSEN